MATPDEQPDDGADPLVSCVLIFHNAERTIAEAIESVVAQSWPRWELILVDDGSTDASRAVAAAFRDVDPDRMRILTHPGEVNRGKSVSRNLGFAAARGALIAMIDADDAWLPAKLAEQVAIMRANPRAALSYGPVHYWYGWTGRPQDQCRDTPSDLGVPADGLIAPPGLLTAMLRADRLGLQSTCPYPSAVIFRRALLDRIGGFEEDFTQLYDDTLFFAKAFIAAPAHVSSKALTRYRLHPDEYGSASYARAIAEGQWHPRDPNPAERAYLHRLRAILGGRGDIGLKIGLWRADLRYRRPGLHAAIAPFRAVRARLGRFARRFGARSHVRPGEVDWGELGRRPIGGDAGAGGRGAPIAALQFEAFLAAHAADIAGDVAEIGDDALTRRFAPVPPRSTTILSPAPILARSGAANGARFDCLIAPDIVRFSDDPRATVDVLCSLLREAGVLLTSVPAIAPMLPIETDRWRFTARGARDLFAAVFGRHAVTVAARGDLAAATAVLHHMGGGDLDPSALNVGDERFAGQIMIRARRG